MSDFDESLIVDFMECPKCSSPMRQRKRKSDGNFFWGCSRFPNCRGTRSGPNDQNHRNKSKSRSHWKNRQPRNPQLPKCPEKLPSALSPTKAIDFMQCPRKFYESSISKRITFQGSEATVKGNLVHHALEMIFKLPHSKRNLENATSHIYPYWMEIKKLPENKSVSELPDREINILLEEATSMVQKWFQIENPKRIEPLACELKIETQIGNAPMRGVIDRVDNSGVFSNPLVKRKHVKVIDYKTGKVPKPEYVHESLFQINTYALALEASQNVVVNEVELLYVTHKHSIKRKVSDTSRSETSNKFIKIWKEIEEACKTGLFPAHPQPLCDWCDAKPICPVWKS